MKIAALAAWLSLAPLAAMAHDTDAPAALATPVEAFLGSLGVNVHLSYKDTAYADPNRVASDLAYLGVSHAREGLPMKWSTGGGGGEALEDHLVLARAGVKFDFVLEAGKAFNPAEATAALDGIERASPGSISAIEGFNEINNWPVTYQGEKSVPAAVAAMEAFYAAVHADPVLQGLPVYDMTGAPAAPTLAGRADFANAHPYPHNGKPPSVAASTEYSGTGLDPRVITEIGNFSLPAIWPAGKPWWEGYTMLGVDERTQAKSILVSYFAAAEAGIARTYVYELLDEKPDPASKEAEWHFGLFRNDHSPKPSAVAIHNLTRFLREKPKHPQRQDSGFTYSVEGAPKTMHQLLMRRSDGSLVLAVWNDAPFWLWTGPKATPLDAAPVPVTLNLGPGSRTITVFDPLTNISTHPTRQQTLVVGLKDYPLLITISR